MIDKDIMFLSAIHKCLTDAFEFTGELSDDMMDEIWSDDNASQVMKFMLDDLPYLLPQFLIFIRQQKSH